MKKIKWKIEFLKLLEEVFCETLSINPPNIVIENGGKRIKGKNTVSSFYDGKIYISDYYLLNNILPEVIITLAHECRHAYQWNEVYSENPIENKEVIEQWKYDFDNYKKNVDAQSKYYMQEIEIDATAFSGFVALALFKTELNLPKELKREVDKRVMFMNNNMLAKFLKILENKELYKLNLN